MYIKEININGFKSFADRVNIVLTPTFTGIVGPNGSGKSNVVDAIKWVLGEQSVKSLRSSGMTDVIFNGSKSRGPSSSASVTIVFDNASKTIPVDYSEVSIKRIVYKSGENEYYLNNEKCRLKDITNLLIDSFSSKESFNIIPQGKIEEILSDKPEDRRIIFEEAAGVLKYKRRKDESLRKLASTHENVERIEMIISELESQLLPLEEASLKAREYKECKEKLESVEIALIAKDITSHNLVAQTLKEEKEKLELSFEEENTDLTKNNTDLEKYKLELLKIEESINSSQEALIEINDKLGKLSSQKALMQERSKYDKSEDSVKVNLISLKEEELKLTNEISGIKIDIQNSQNKEEELTSKLKLLSDELGDISKKRNLLSDEYSSNKKREIEVTGKIDLLENTILNMSKIPYSVKSVLNAPSLDGIDNIIGNIVETEEKYSLMLEVALGISSNFVIVKDEESAKKAINYLKVNSKGRVTFFPLNVIKPRSIDPSILDIAKSVKGFVGVASDLVSFESKYYNIIMNQLGNIIIASDIDSAVAISKNINYRYRIVSLNGDLVNVGGSLTGGSAKDVNSSIGDKFELVRLKMLLKHIEEEIKSFEEKINEIDYNINVIKDNIYKMNIEFLNNKENLQNKNNKFNELSNKLESISFEIKSLSSSNKDKIDAEIKKVMDEYYNIDKKKIELNKNVENLVVKKNNLIITINDLEAFIKKSNSNNGEYRNKLNENEVNTVRVNMTLDNLLNRLNEEYNLTYENASKNYELEIEESEARNIVFEFKKKIKSFKDINLGSIEDYDRVNKRYTFLSSQKNDLVQSENNLMEIINSMNEVMIERFSETFKNINIEFNKVFKQLFGGGDAELRLTDPANILETGIDIIAIPSGKTLKPISLLSGGEKTLTAVSLLFAIMNLRKVPFAILDEVESALDDVNAEKFGEYLQNYKGKTQLLIITHKKKTMEYVDLLYGITMQESGISKLVSVRLEEIK